MELSFTLSFIYNTVFHILLLCFFGALFYRQARRRAIVGEQFLYRDFLGAMMTLQFIGVKFYTGWWKNMLTGYYGLEDGISLLNLMNIVVFPFVLFIFVAAFFELEKFENIPSIHGIIRSKFGNYAGFISWIIIIVFCFMMLMEKIEMVAHFSRTGENYLNFKRKGLDIFFQLVKMGSFALEFPLFLAYLFSTADILNILLPIRKRPWISKKIRFRIIVGVVTLLVMTLKISNWAGDLNIIRPVYLYFFSVLAVPFLAIIWGFKVDSRSFFLTISTFLLIFFACLLIAFLKEDSLIKTSIMQLKAGKSSTLLNFAEIGSIGGSILSGLVFFVNHYVTYGRIVWTEDVD